MHREDPEKKMRCIYCGGKPFYHRRYSGETLCRRHFIETIDKRVYREARKHLKEDSRVGLAVSGGKDSLVLAYSVNKLKKRFPDMELIGLIVDEGISGYRERAIKKADKALSHLSVIYHVFNFRDHFSTTLDEAIRLLGKDAMPCSLCGVLRRRAISILAEETEVEAVLTGHNADDMAQTIILNIVQGNVRNLAQEIEFPGVVKRFKPLKEVLEKEVVLYGLMSGIDYYSDPCPYSGFALRNDIRNFLLALETNHSGVTYSIIRSAEKIIEGISPPPKIGRCMRCSYPTTRELCKVCEVLRKVEELKQTSERG
ncbi:MAG: TIGR00269 family protein [Nitrososphaeria archaeon]|nr:TIGR00269 family protein [Nitrososphaeria archaeon]NIQ32987.1 TIGR00269 family protein [Nitrososphaeria archaeon]